MYYGYEGQNYWGLGLVNYQHAEFLYFLEQTNIQIQERNRKASFVGNSTNASVSPLLQLSRNKFSQKSKFRTFVSDSQVSAKSNPGV